MTKVLLLLLTLYCTLPAQEPDMIKALQLIERGKADSVRMLLAGIKNTESAGYIFLDALTTEQGQNSIIKFEKLLKIFPDYVYNDAAIFRLHSYYYALGSYNRAKELAAKLEKEYPNSPYRKQLDKMLYSEEAETVQTVPESPRVVENSEPKQKGYILQVGAFLNKTNAERLRNGLVSAGYETFLEEKEIGGSLFLVVLVGEFNSEKETETVKQKIDREFKTNAKIIAPEQ